MKVIAMNHKNDCCFEDIKVGAVFEHDNEYYIKSDNIDADTHEHLYALNLEAGKTKRFAKNDKVLVCDAKLYVEEGYV